MDPDIEDLGGGASELRRLGGILLSPVRTFADIGRRPTWVFPLLLVLVVNLLTNLVVYRVLLTDENLEEIALEVSQWQAAKNGGVAPTAATAAEIESLRRLRSIWYVPSLVGVAASVLGIAAFFYGILRLIRAGNGFRRIFAVVCWSFVIYRVVGGTVTLVSLLVRGSSRFRPAPPEAWSPTSLARWIPPEAVSANVYSALSKLDLFLVWWLVVLAIGLWQTSRNLSLRGAVALVVLCEGSYLVLNALGALPGAS